MSLDENTLQHPKRDSDLEHDRYAWSRLAERRPVAWPGGKHLAVWVNVSLQWLPFHGGDDLADATAHPAILYPDLRHYTLRDYGNRIGIYRLLQAFDRYGVRPTFACNARLAQQYPALMQEIVARGSEIIGHSWHMDMPRPEGPDQADGQEDSNERAQTAASLNALRRVSGRDIRGWFGPGHLQSAHTPELLRAQGIDYFCDGGNEDMPYRFHTRLGDLWSMPLSSEQEDRFVLMENFHAEGAWLRQFADTCDLLLDEAREQGGRILSLSLHPWVLGQSHRIRYLEAALEYVMSREGVWSAGAGEIVRAFAAQQRGTDEAAP